MWRPTKSCRAIPAQARVTKVPGARSAVIQYRRKASGATITITPGSIKIKGDFDSSEASIVTGKDVNE